jgi:hypothetical protein
VQSSNFFKKNNVFLEVRKTLCYCLEIIHKNVMLVKELAMPNAQGHALYLKCLKPQPHPEKVDCLIVSMDLPSAMIRDAIESLQALAIPHQLITVQGRTSLCLSRSSYEQAVVLKND